MERPSWDHYFMEMAELTARRSTCLRRSVGAVIVKDKHIVATGYNGAPRRVEHCEEKGGCMRQQLGVPSGQRHELCRAVHAEQNALIAASRDRLIGATAYLACEEYGPDQKKSDFCTFQIMDWYEDENPVPCPICMRMLKNAGIARIVNRRGNVCL